MKSREKASGFRGGTHTHTHRVGARGRSGRPIYIYVIYIYVIYTLLYIQGGKPSGMQLVHVKVAHILTKRGVRSSASG